MMYVHIAVFSQVPIRDALRHPRGNQERWEHQCWAAFVPSPLLSTALQTGSTFPSFPLAYRKMASFLTYQNLQRVAEPSLYLDVTSASLSPVLDKSRALGMLRKLYVTPKNASFILEPTCLEHGQDYKTRCFLFPAQCLKEASSAKCL